MTFLKAAILPSLDRVPSGKNSTDAPCTHQQLVSDAYQRQLIDWSVDKDPSTTSLLAPSADTRVQYNALDSLSI